jgi:hypothetical protein
MRLPRALSALACALGCGVGACADAHAPLGPELGSAPVGSRVAGTQLRGRSTARGTSTPVRSEADCAVVVGPAVAEFGVPTRPR